MVIGLIDVGGATLLVVRSVCVVYSPSQLVVPGPQPSSGQLELWFRGGSSGALLADGVGILSPVSDTIVRTKGPENDYWTIAVGEEVVVLVEGVLY